MLLQEKISEMNETLRTLKNVSNVIVWGAGLHTCKLFEKTNLYSYSIKNIVDMNVKKQGSFYFGFFIKSPMEVVWKNVGAVVISVPSKENQIAEMLREQFGYKGTIIRLYRENECTPFYLLYDRMISSVRYMGNYDSWENASKECKGYSDVAIIDKVSSSIKKILEGSAVWERDGYLFYEPKYSYQICAAILRCAVQNNNQGVRVLDLGGALGSTYFQNRKYLNDIRNLEYVVAEQNNFTDYGHKNLENGELYFINSMEDFSSYDRFDIVLMSASLQYISNYKEVIFNIRNGKPRYIILDRVLVGDKGRICKETVPEEIYKSSYPVRIFDEEEILNLWGRDYKLVEKDSSSVAEDVYFIDGKAESRFYVFQYTN